MSSSDSDITFDSAGLAEFLDHIADYERQELDRLAEQFESELHLVRMAARRESRRYHHDTAQTTRARLESDRSRLLSRARSDFRRRRWQVLDAWRKRVRELIEIRLLENWRDPDLQWIWCRHWVLKGRQLFPSEYLRIEISDDCHESTLQRLEELLDGYRCKLEAVAGMQSGLMIHGQSKTVDGRLNLQVKPLLDKVNSELASWLHQPQSENTDE